MTLKLINELVQQFSDVLPSSFSHLKKEWEEQFRHGLVRALEKLDLVTRQEFDAQTKVLARTREKLEKLKHTVDLLEASKNK